MATTMELPPSLLLPHVDELVMEYLLFRGFTKSFQVFSAERKRDRAKGFDVEQIIAQLLSYVQTYQVDALLETWKFLAARFFNHLDASYAETIHSLETSLLRLYVVNAIKTGQREHAVEFFKSFISSTPHANKLNATISSASDTAAVNDSWCRWFILPFIQQPESDAYFQVFFSTDWLDAFVTSLRNFFTLIFRNVALPKLLAFQLTRLEEPALKMRLRMSQSECNRLRLFNVDANARIKKLEAAGQQLHSLLRRMVQHSYVEHFARGSAPSGGAVFSSQQLQELGELFGIHNTNTSAATSDNDAPGAQDPSRDRLSQSELVNGADDALTCDDDLSPLPQPSLRAKSPNGHRPATAALSLVRRLDCASGATLSTSVERLAVGSAAALASAAAALCRIAPDGMYVARAVLGDRTITIWSTQADARDANEAVAAPVASTPLRLVSPLTTMSWVASSASSSDGGDGDDQLLLYGLADGTLNLWSMNDAKRVARIQCDSGMAPSQLVAASQAPQCLLLTTTQSLANGSVSDPPTRSRQLLQLIRARPASPPSASHELVRQTVWRCSDDVTCIACDGSASVFATASRTGSIEIYDSKLRHPVLSWHATASANSSSTRRRITSGCDDTADPIRALALAPDGLSILSLSTAPSSASPSPTSVVITEWACSDVSIASPRDGTSNDSSEDDSELRPAASAPPIRCTYALECQDSDCSSSKLLQYKLQFDATGRQFVLTTHAEARLVSVHVFQRGDPQAHAVDLLSSSSSSSAEPATLVAFDWTATETSPLCSTWSSDSVLSLWRLGERDES